MGEAMFSRVGLLAGVCALTGVFATGCGSSTTKTVTTTAPPAATTTPATTTPATTTPAATTPATTTPTASSTSSQLKAAEAANPAIAAEVAQAVAACKTSVNSAATLTADDKSKLDAICVKAGDGDAAGVQQASSQVCQEIIKDTVPSAEQSQALAACPKP
jgi:UTP:GlnB (protein PII) uridylyltransferase